MPIRVEADGTFGWDQLAAMLGSATFGPALELRIAQAHRRVGQMFVRRAVEAITREKPFAPNSPVTRAIKGSSTPLVDHGDLVGNLTFDVQGHERLVMGVNSRRLPSGRILAEVLHNGAVVTDRAKIARMRRAVFAKLRAKLGAAGFRSFTAGIGAPANEWRIPARPFLTHVWEDRGFLAAVEKVYLEALENAFDDAKKKGG